MDHTILDQIPPTILQSVKRHLEVIDDFNTAVLRARGLEPRFGSPGRYEWEFRLAREPQTQASTAWLARFAAQEVYDALGVSPTPLPWSTAAQEWRR